MGHDNNPFYPSQDPQAALREDQREFLETAEISLGLPNLFYASLRDPRVFQVVVGRPMDTVEWEPATVEGFRFGVVNTGSMGFPGIFPSSSVEPLDCLITRGLTRFEQTMIAWYEWDEYVLRRIPLAHGRAAQAFVPNLEAIRREHGRINIEPWSFEAWQSSHVDRTVADARAWMAQRPSDAALAHAGCLRRKESPEGGRATG